MNNYQKLAARTLIDKPDAQYSDQDLMIIWNAVGLAGEAGEVADLVKKGIFHQHGLDKAKLFKELGDCLWYIAGMCTKMGWDMDDVMQANIDKLRERYPNGYSTNDSIKRIDVLDDDPWKNARGEDL
jgi:NTP pyrophosphatase (non-canonical NTP hydrolase)